MHFYAHRLLIVRVTFVVGNAIFSGQFGHSFHGVRTNVYWQKHSMGEQMVRSHVNATVLVAWLIIGFDRCSVVRIFFCSELYTIQFRRQLSSLGSKRGFDARCRQMLIFTIIYTTKEIRYLVQHSFDNIHFTEFSVARIFLIHWFRVTCQLP